MLALDTRSPRGATSLRLRNETLSQRLILSCCLCIQHQRRSFMVIVVSVLNLCVAWHCQQHFVLNARCNQYSWSGRTSTPCMAVQSFEGLALL